MQTSQLEFSLRDLDRVLDELEDLAVSPETSTPDFYQACLLRLQAVLHSPAVGLAVSLSADNWNLLYGLGKWDWSATLKRVSDQSSNASSGSKSGGDLVVCFAGNPPGQLAVIAGLGSPLDSVGYAEVSRLCEAFAEVIGVRIRHDLESCQKRFVPAFQQLLAHLHRSTKVSESECLLANDLLVVLQAERVTVVRSLGLKGPHARAISNLIGPVKSSSLVKQLEKIGKRVLIEQKPIIGNNRPESSTNPKDDRPDELQPYLAVPLGPSGANTGKSDTAILVQWASQEKLLVGAAIWEQIGLTLGLLWSNHQRWLRLPRWSRRISESAIFGHNRRASRWIRLALRVGVVTLIGWMLLSPRDLRIELDGTLEPVGQRTLFAALDGTIDQVLVTDGQSVQAGQLLAAMKSSELQMQIKEVEGEVSALAEKRKGLSLSFNQISSDESAAPAVRNRLASEIRQLDTHNGILLQKRSTLKELEQKLELRSPIDGIVMARDIELMLDQRPVRRGDGILRVVAPDSDWCLRLQIADADVGYLRKKLQSVDDSQIGLSKHANTKIQFLYVAKPHLSFSAQIDWLSTAARNPQGNGVIVDLTAVPEPDAIKQGHVGATVKAYITCDRRPTWFVLSRPLVEAIQRKLWF